MRDGMGALRRPTNISTRARGAESAFITAIESCSSNRDASREIQKDRESLEDSHIRYRLWAGNLAAFLPAWDPKSLQHRLQPDGAVSQRVQDVLEELTDLLHRFATWDSTKANAVEVPAEGEPSDEADEFLEDFLGLKTSRACELSWVTSSIADAIRQLFKVSRLIEKSTTRDRYARAEIAVKTKFLDQFDVAHVREKHGTPQAESWLLDRLGKAITKRRVFLKYTQEHRERLGSQRDLEPSTIVDIQQPTPAAPLEQPVAPTIRRSEVSKPSLQLTSATTLGPIDLNAVDYGFDTVDNDVDDDDERSFYTKASSINNARSSDRLRVVRLQEVATKSEPFQCPYCNTIQKFNGQISWERHVFADLRAYLCTFEKCGMRMFTRKQEWIKHETEEHRRQWQCQSCDHAPFQSEESLLSHTKQVHKPVLSSEATEALLKTSSRPMSLISVKACQLCDWDPAMRKVNSHVDATEELMVSMPQFMKHLSGHLEELALFAIPRGNPEENSEDAEGSTKGSHRGRDEVLFDVSGYVAALDESPTPLDPLAIEPELSPISPNSRQSSPQRPAQSTNELSIAPDGRLLSPTHDAQKPQQPRMKFDWQSKLPTSTYDRLSTSSYIPRAQSRLKPEDDVWPEAPDPPSTLNVDDWFEFFGVQDDDRPSLTVVPNSLDLALPALLSREKPSFQDISLVLLCCVKFKRLIKHKQPTIKSAEDWFEFFGLPQNADKVEVKNVARRGDHSASTINHLQPPQEYPGIHTDPLSNHERSLGFDLPSANTLESPAYGNLEMDISRDSNRALDDTMSLYPDRALHSFKIPNTWSLDYSLNTMQREELQHSLQTDGNSDARIPHPSLPAPEQFPTFSYGQDPSTGSSMTFSLTDPGSYVDRGLTALAGNENSMLLGTSQPVYSDSAEFNEHRSKIRSATHVAESNALAPPSTAGRSASLSAFDNRPRPQCWDHGCNGRVFSTFSNLLRHQRTEANALVSALNPRSQARPRPRPQCWEHGCNGREFATFSHLLRHRRTQEGTDFTCEECGRKFYNRDNYLKHIRSPHTGTLAPRRSGYPRSSHISQSRERSPYPALAPLPVIVESAESISETRRVLFSARAQDYGTDPAAATQGETADTHQDGDVPAVSNVSTRSADRPSVEVVEELFI